MSLSDLLSTWREDPSIAANVAAWQVIPARPARLATRHAVQLAERTDLTLELERPAQLELLPKLRYLGVRRRGNDPGQQEQRGRTHARRKHGPLSH